MSELIVTDKIDASGHVLPEAWLRSRVRGWMSLESQGFPFWIGAYKADGEWIYCSSDEDSWAPEAYRQEYARNVNAHLNRQCSFDGAWLTGWIGHEFYMLWKDKDGDLQIPIECDKPFIVLGEWGPDVWERHACTAWAKWNEHHKNLELGRKQNVKVAQGEKTTAEHLQNAPKLRLPL